MQTTSMAETIIFPQKGGLGVLVKSKGKKYPKIFLEVGQKSIDMINI